MDHRVIRAKTCFALLPGDDDALDMLDRSHPKAKKEAISLTGQ
jgi:hypothetical protein